MEIEIPNAKVKGQNGLKISQKTNLAHVGDSLESFINRASQQVILNSKRKAEGQCVNNLFFKCISLCHPQ